jgi:shikimate dehydrogenase
MIRGTTELIAHIGWPTHTFKSPMIYNPYFEKAGIDAIVVPMGCKPENYATLLKSVFSLENIRGALITMPHKVSTVDLLDEASPTVQISGSCNAVRRGPDGRLQGDMFDGEGFVRGLRRKGCQVDGARALVVGCGGVGSAIAASLAGAGVAAMGLVDARAESALALGLRLVTHYPALSVATGRNDPDGFSIVVNATPMGMNDGDPMPMDVSRIAPETFVGEVVMKTEMTAFLKAAQARGCRFQVGSDMLFEQIPAYLEYFGFPTTTPDELRAVAQIQY